MTKKDLTAVVHTENLGYEMTHIAFRSMEEVLYCFLRSSVKFQGHMGWKIDSDLSWDYKASCSYQIPQIRLVHDFFFHTPILFYGRAILINY